MATITDYQRQLDQWAKRRAEMAKLKASGWTLTAIGARYGISRQRVYQALREANGRKS
jgi:hypothetical protein